MSDTFLPPELFDEGSIDPETRQINDKLLAMMNAAPPISDVPVEVMREQRAQGKGAFKMRPRSERAIDRAIPGRDGHDIGLRMVVPDSPKGVYLHFHGGGWINGANDQNDPLLEHLADLHGLAVVSVEYRLAPEHRFPAAPNDCEDAACWLAANSKGEFGTDWLSIGGESAGAHLSVLTLLRMRDTHGYAGFKAANLVFGVYDVSLTPSARNWDRGRLVLDTDTIRWFATQFVPDPHIQRTPKVSPLFAQLHDMPPALFTVGTLDPLLDDTLFMYSRWSAAGNAGRLEVFKGGAHGFPAFGGPLAKRFTKVVDQFLSERLSANA